ncbi:MAG: hypothetical protein Q8M18_13110, partial [Bradyrhizobium sp.]|nr:hypothetical protein [Bradyrhizobium sp.]
AVLRAQAGAAAVLLAAAAAGVAVLLAGAAEVAVLLGAGAAGEALLGAAAVRRPAVPDVRRAEQPSAVLSFHPDQHLSPPVRRLAGRFAPATKVLRTAWP